MCECLTGDDCEYDFDGCRLSACSVGRNCTDRPAAEHAADHSLTAFTCSPCPSGYQDDGSKCEGKYCKINLLLVDKKKTNQWVTKCNIKWI